MGWAPALAYLGWRGALRDITSFVRARPPSTATPDLPPPPLRAPPFFLSRLSPSDPSPPHPTPQIDHFKSYGRPTVIPFASGLTAVIGPNGSGKSNVLDATAFVLGVRTAQLRGANLGDLVYTNTDAPVGGRGRAEGAAGDAASRRAAVVLVFEAADGQVVRFSRHISPAASGAATAGGAPAYTSQYRLNDRAVTWDAYDAQLKAFGILVKARNFLVFQGDIEGVASMSPAGLAEMFEHVSGSGALKAAYEEAEAKKAAAEAAAASAFSKKRATAAERKARKDQKDEAEKFIALQAALGDAKRTLYLVQLAAAAADVKAARAAAAADAAALGAAKDAAAAAEAEAEDARRAAAGLHKARMAAERRVNKRRAEVEAACPDALRAREEGARLARREKDLARRVEAAAKARDAQADTIARLEADLAAVEEAQAAAERADGGAGGPGDDEGGGRGGLHLDAGMQAEFYRVKEEAGSKTARMRASRDALLAGVRADEAALSALRATLSGVVERRDALEAEAAALRARAAATAADLAAARSSLASTAAALEAVIVDKRQALAKREQWGLKLEAAEAALRDAKADRKESERDSKAAATVAHMKGMFPGVHGRLSELTTVSQRQYGVALAVVLGKDMDSVVTADERAAKDCIAYLKQARLPPMTFIPADTVRAKPTNEALRSLGGTARLALDLLQFDPALDRPLRAVCGDTLVCEGEGEAKSLAFQGPERHKVVTLDGTLISRAGLITGGRSAGMDARASRFDDAALAGLKASRRECAEALDALPSARDAEREEARLHADAARLEREVQLKDEDGTSTAARLARVEAEVEALEAERARRAPDADALEAAVEAGAGRAEDALARIHAVEDRVFAPFSAKAGVLNVRAHMEAHTAAAAERAKRRMALASQASKVGHQLSYERRRDLVGPATEVGEELASARARRAECEQVAAAAAASMQAAEGELAGEAAKVADLKAQAEGAEAAAREKRKAAGAATAKAAALKAAGAARAADVEAAAGRAADVLETADMEGVVLPRLDPAARRRGRRGRGDSMEVDGEEEGAEGGGGADADDLGAGGLEDAAAAAAALAALAALDFGDLPAELKAAAASPRERERVEAALRAEIEEHAADLAKGAPNLKAVDQYEAVRAREAAQAGELDGARSAAREAADAFEGIRARRHDLFMRAFEHAAAAVNDVFKDLTRSPAHPTGGSAYLALDSADDPYLGGVKFTAMPPAKRYRDMDALSGGEKTLSALALLFAIHSFQAAPFFVLDEVDAALDAANVARVAQYIARKARGDAAAGVAPLQAVVISLKDGFYQHADALVGVCRDPDAGCSATLTFDLDAYGPAVVA